MSSIIPTDIPIFCTLVGSIGNFNKLRCSSPLWLPLTLQKLISACLPKLSIDYANRVMKAIDQFELIIDFDELLRKGYN